MTPIVEQKERSPYRPDTHVGHALFVPPDLTLHQSDHDTHWHSALREAGLGLPIGVKAHFEVQYEQPYRTGYWRSLIDPVRALGSGDVTVGLHSPSLNPELHDLGNPNGDIRRQAVRETVDALRFAAASGCNDYVLHLTPFDDFGWDARRPQLARAMESLRYIADAVGGDPGVRVLIENLEFPKWPATTHETIEVMSIIHEERLFSDTGVCLDFAHLWHNLVSLLPAVEDRTQFAHVAREFIRQVSDVSPIHRVHLAGAFINYEGDDHQTHAIPGKHPVNPADQSLYFDGAPDDFNGLWMSVNDALRAMVGIDNPAHDISLVVEAHEPNAAILHAYTMAIRKKLRDARGA